MLNYIKHKKYKKQIKVRGLGASAVIPSISGYGPTVSNEGVQQMQNALHELAKDPDAYAAWLQRTEESVDKWYSGQRKPNLAATQRLANVLGVINALPEGAPINEAQIAELQAAGREFSEHPYLDTAPEA